MRPTIWGALAVALLALSIQQESWVLTGLFVIAAAVAIAPAHLVPRSWWKVLLIQSPLIRAGAPRTQGHTLHDHDNLRAWIASVPFINAGTAPAKNIGGRIACYKLSDREMMPHRAWGDRMTAVWRDPNESPGVNQIETTFEHVVTMEPNLQAKHVDLVISPMGGETSYVVDLEHFPGIVAQNFLSEIPCIVGIELTGEGLAEPQSFFFRLNYEGGRPALTAVEGHHPLAPSARLPSQRK